MDRQLLNPVKFLAAVALLCGAGIAIICGNIFAAFLTALEDSSNMVMPGWAFIILGLIFSPILFLLWLSSPPARPARKKPSRSAAS